MVTSRQAFIAPKPLIGTNTEIIRGFNGAMGDRKWNPNQQNGKDDVGKGFRTFDTRFGVALKAIDPMLEKLRNGLIKRPGTDWQASEFDRLNELIASMTVKLISDKVMTAVQRTAGDDGQKMWFTLRYWYNRVSSSQIKKLRSKVNKVNKVTSPDKVLDAMEDILDAASLLRANGKEVDDDSIRDALIDILPKEWETWALIIDTQVSVFHIKNLPPPPPTFGLCGG